MPTDEELLAQVNKLGTELQKRARTSRKLHNYRDGECPFPAAVVRARLTNAYQALMPMAAAAWGGLVVDSVQDRLTVAGIRSDDQATDEAVWGVWQDNAMDAESKLAHDSALVDGRSFATIWPDASGKPEIVLDNAEQMIVQYQEGSRRKRVAALRYWMDGDVPHATLYRPEAIYKFAGPKNSSGFSGTQWERRDVLDEAWPLDNPFRIVPVVELAVNRRLKPGCFGSARGEFENCLGVIDKINLLTFLGLVVALWMGFPLRGVIGDKIAYEILKDDDGNPILDSVTNQPVEKPVAPFDADADSVFQLENPDAKIVSYDAADRKNLSVFAELTELAYLTKTPAHYFPLSTGISNISADAIVALEGGMHAKTDGHKGSLGEGWEEALRVAGMMLPTPVALSPRAALAWRDSESRSLAERADAAVKLKDLLPWQAIAERVLDATNDEIDRWTVMRASDGFNALLAAAASSVPAVVPTAPPAK